MMYGQKNIKLICGVNKATVTYICPGGSPAKAHWMSRACYLYTYVCRLAAVFFARLSILWVSPDSVFDIATRYGLDRPGIESQWGRYLPHPSRLAPGAHPTSYTMGTGSLSRG